VRYGARFQVWAVLRRLGRGKEQIGVADAETLSSSAASTPSTRKLRLALWTLAAAIGAADAWAQRFAMNSDGIHYIEVGEAYLHGDWQHAINAYWSPMYSWLLAGVLRLARPSAREEYAVVHAVNFGVYLLALSCLGYLIRQCVAYSSKRTASSGASKPVRVPLPEAAWIALGYALFLQSSLRWITLWRPTPDLCVEAVLFLASGLLLRLGTAPAGLSVYAALGGVLGIGYLTKTAVLPLSFAYLATALFVGDRAWRNRIRGFFTSLAVLLAVALPFVTAISLAKGRLTIGDSGRLNYQWYTNGAPRDWSVPGLVHPPTRLLLHPTVYGFPKSVGGTWPGHFDPSYWCEGEKVALSVKRLAARAYPAVSAYANMTTENPLFLYAYITALLLVLGTAKRVHTSLLAGWPLLAPALSGLCMYAAVGVLPRYVGHLVAILWMGLFIGVSIHGLPKAASHFATKAAMALLACCVVVLAPDEVRQLGRAAVAASASGGVDTNNQYWQAAQALTSLGCAPGSQIAMLGAGHVAVVAHLARVRIAAAIMADEDGLVSYPRLGEVLTPSGQLQQRVADAFRRAGAVAFVVTQVPAYLARTGWHRLGNTDYYAYMLTSLRGSSQAVSAAGCGR